jgi:hypothetical protein
MLYVIAIVLLAMLFFIIFSIGSKSAKRDTTIVLEKMNQDPNSAENH